MRARSISTRWCSCVECVISSNGDTVAFRLFDQTMSGVVSRPDVERMIEQVGSFLSAIARGMVTKSEYTMVKQSMASKLFKEVRASVSLSLSRGVCAWCWSSIWSAGRRYDHARGIQAARHAQQGHPLGLLDLWLLLPTVDRCHGRSFRMQQHSIAIERFRERLLTNWRLDSRADLEWLEGL